MKEIWTTNKYKLVIVFINIFNTSILGTSEIDQLYKIASILGTPGRNDWPDGYSLAGNMQFKFPTFKSTHLTQVLKYSKYFLNNQKSIFHE